MECLCSSRVMIHNSVTTLECPNNPSVVAVYKVKLENLTFEEFVSFSDRFPNAREYEGNLFNVGGDLSDSILNVVDGTSVEANIGSLVFNSSCCVRGVKSNVENTMCNRPGVRVSATVAIMCELDDSIVQFEDINFMFDTADMIACCRLNNIIFRRCCFTCKDNGCVIEGTTEEVVNVLFESCLFEDCSERAVKVYKNGNVTLINCVFEKVKVCVSWNSGCSAVFKHCTFLWGYNFIFLVTRKAQTIEFLNCKFFEGAPIAGIFLTKCMSLLLQGCAFKGSNLLLGSVRSAVIEDCTFTHCRYGIVISGPKIAATVSQCHFSNIQDCCISVRQNVIGTLELSLCAFPSDKVKGVQKHQDSQCVITMDNAPTFVGPAPAVNTAAPAPTATRAVPVSGAGKQQWGKLRALRMQNRMFGRTKAILCFACDKEEPEGDTFKNCSKCNQACYCSRECQVADWGEHKSDCLQMRESLSEQTVSFP